MSVRVMLMICLKGQSKCKKRKIQAKLGKYPNYSEIANKTYLVSSNTDKGDFLDVLPALDDDLLCVELPFAIIFGLSALLGIGPAWAP